MTMITQFARVVIITGLMTLQSAAVGAQVVSGTVVGSWAGMRAERNPRTGRTFTINFTFDFAAEGTYQYQANYGSGPILDLQGRYTLRQTGVHNSGGNRGPEYTLNLSPSTVARTPSADDLLNFKLAGLPHIEPSAHVLFFDSPSSANLDGRPGPERWGFNRVPNKRADTVPPIADTSVGPWTKAFADATREARMSDRAIVGTWDIAGSHDCSVTFSQQRSHDAWDNDAQWVSNQRIMGGMVWTLLPITDRQHRRAILSLFDRAFAVEDFGRGDYNPLKAPRSLSEIFGKSDERSFLECGFPPVKSVALAVTCANLAADGMCNAGLSYRFLEGPTKDRVFTLVRQR